MDKPSPVNFWKTQNKLLKDYVFVIFFDRQVYWREGSAGNEFNDKTLLLFVSLLNPCLVQINCEQLGDPQNVFLIQCFQSGCFTLQPMDSVLRIRLIDFQTTDFVKLSLPYNCLAPLSKWFARLRLEKFKKSSLVPQSFQRPPSFSENQVQRKTPQQAPSPSPHTAQENPGLRYQGVVNFVASESMKPMKMATMIASPIESSPSLKFSLRFVICFARRIAKLRMIFSFFHSVGSNGSSPKEIRYWRPVSTHSSILSLKFSSDTFFHITEWVSSLIAFVKAFRQKVVWKDRVKTKRKKRPKKLTDLLPFPVQDLRSKLWIESLSPHNQYRRI